MVKNVTPKAAAIILPSRAVNQPYETTKNRERPSI